MIGAHSFGRPNVEMDIPSADTFCHHFRACLSRTVHPSGKFLYGSNRGHESIAVFAIAPNGTLTLIENIARQGKIPQNFGIDPAGSFLLAANQDSSQPAKLSMCLRPYV